MTTTGSVTSQDGTTIAYRTTGAGRALVVVPGNNRMAHDYDRLATALGDAFAVTVIERRGRGASGPQGADYALDREVEDLAAVAEAVGASDVFGHSYGGLVALVAARAGRIIHRLAVYEPGVSIDGSFDLSFRGRFRELLGRGKHVRAMALFLHRTRLLPFGWTPYPVCWALSVLMVGRRGEMRDLMPTTPAELDEVARADGDGMAYAAITADTLLVAGTRSPGYLTGVLEPLSRIIPRSHRVSLDGADHNAPDESAPERVAVELRRFFA
ncbi:alpha/beta hydrolase [Leifsonia sp. NPDC080035]|uniref:Alpha/beta hydrolase n=1 Tax=Leifsonia sp. NPDC080035 TaxID=3143936 RepID=A0AAU7GFC1_9MICO